MVRISAKRCFTEPWMTTGLEESSRKCKELYKNSLQKGSSKESTDHYRMYRNMLNKMKRKTKIKFYNEKCIRHKNDTKQLWKIINATVCKRKNTGSIIPFITIDGIRKCDPEQISNAFGKFYANLGQDLAKGISPGIRDINHYLNKIPRSVCSFVMSPTTLEEVNMLIKMLPNKSSSGRDKISNVMLKGIRESISFPLTGIFNL